MVTGMMMTCDAVGVTGYLALGVGSRGHVQVERRHLPRDAKVAEDEVGVGDLRVAAGFEARVERHGQAVAADRAVDDPALVAGEAERGFLKALLGDLIALLVSAAWVKGPAGGGLESGVRASLVETTTFGVRAGFGG